MKKKKIRGPGGKAKKSDMLDETKLKQRGVKSRKRFRKKIGQG